MQNVFHNLINITPNINSGFANSVSQLSKRITKMVQFDKSQPKHMTLIIKEQ
jgi:hypothetical protein